MRAKGLAIVVILAVISAITVGFSTAYAAEQTTNPENSDSYMSVFDHGGAYRYGALGAWVNGVARTKSTIGAESASSKKTAAGKKTYESYTWDNGDTYKGWWLGDFIHGKGVYTVAGGSAVYKGIFNKGDFYSGTYTEIKGNNSLQIKYKDGKQYKALIRLEDGFVYKGGFSKGKLNGKGVGKFASGAKYTGNFTKGKRSGKGTYKWASGAKYVGAWKSDKMNGKGTYTYPKSSSAKKLVGTFTKNLPKGTCKYTTRSGKTYKTVWKKGKCVKVTR